MTSQAWVNLPAEMRRLPQWLLASPNEAGELKVPSTVAFGSDDYVLIPGSSTDPSTWLPFEEACRFAEGFGCGIGFVLSADDPFTCVDMDIKNHHNAPHNPEKWTPEHHIAQMKMLVEDLGSYTELSQSLQGVHVWCYGKIGEGIKKNGVELYSQQRFIVCTGKAINSLPIADRQEELNQLASVLRAAQAAARAVLTNDSEQDLTDEEIWRRASTAENKDKFLQLWAGEWKAMGYPSQSEADLSLMSMLTFYSRTNEQCRRMFRYSELGKREKALKNDRYLDYTLRLIRGRQAREDKVLRDIMESSAAMVAQQYSQVTADMNEADEAQQRAMAAAYVAQLQAGAPPAPPPPSPPVPPAPRAGGLPWPPGLVGELARFMYGAAPRPVKEVAIVAALGWMAGVCGKAWVIPGSGLNLYIILVARSGVGKEAMHGGIAALTTRLRNGVSTADAFVNFSEFASGPALAKACAEKSSFVNVAGEFGRKLQRLAQQGNDGPMQSLRTIMTNLYQKSGPTSIAGGIAYSNKESNVSSISGVAYSMIGETTPDTFYSCLTDSMMEDGFLSRFTIIEYDGPRPLANPNPNFIPDNWLAERCQKLVHDAGNMIQNHTRVQLQRTAGAAALMDAFDAECDAQINSSNDEGWRQMWNRAHLKMLRIAGLLCIGDVDPSAPVIDVPHVEWALDVVRRDIALMQKRMESGDVGTGDSSREKKLLHIIHEYLSQPLGEGYKIPAALQRAGIVPRKYLQIRSARIASFSQHPFGQKRALDDALQSLCDSGYIAELDKNKVGEQFTFMGRCFSVVDLPKFS